MPRTTIQKRNSPLLDLHIKHAQAKNGRELKDQLTETSVNYDLIIGQNLQRIQRFKTRWLIIILITKSLQVKRLMN